MVDSPQMRSRKAIIVLVTCPSSVIAKMLATHLLKKRLAACVNIIPGVKSLFWWQGKIDRCSEWLLVIKTEKRLLGSLSQAIRKEHPYKTPEIIALTVDFGDKKYLNWIHNSVVSKPA